jgi:hypothetical protein
MPTLTRRRSDNDHSENWSVYYGDVRVGWIGQRAGVPIDVDQWGWSLGFYPGLEPGQHRDGSAQTFELARIAFEEAWRRLLRNIPEGAFDEYRRDREHRAVIRAIHSRGERLPSEVPSSMMRCVCGVTFDSHKPAESFDHRLPIYAARAKTT